MSAPERDPVTRIIHHPYTPPGGFEAPQPPIQKASTVVFPSVQAMRARDWRSRDGYTYGLHGTPTTFLLEERLCELEGGLQCVLTPSGLAAIANTSLALLRQGDEVLLPHNAYGPGKALAEGELAAYGITHQTYDPLDPDDLARRISDRTRLVWVEAPGSVSMEFPDLPALVNVCRSRGVLCALDNTWGAGLAFRPFDLQPGRAGEALAVDVSIQALTKYPSGGGDVLMGSIITRDHALHLRIKLAHMRLGFGVGANDVELVLRSLPSIGLRYDAHDAAARKLAGWLQSRPEVVQVLHPAVPGAPGHHAWAMLCGGGAPGAQQGRAAGLFSILLHPQYTQDQIDRFCDGLELFKLGFSWGGPVSLVVPYDLAAMRGGWPQHLPRGWLVRLSIGLESWQDLQRDIERALTLAFGS